MTNWIVEVMIGVFVGWIAFVLFQINARLRDIRDDLFRAADALEKCSDSLEVIESAITSQQAK